MLPKTVTFTAVQGEFDLKIAMCATLDCPCKVVSLWLHQVGKRGTNEIRVDVGSWAEIQPPLERSAALEDVARELIRDFPESERQALRQTFADKQTIASHLRTYRLPPDAGRDGGLVYFDEVVLPAGKFKLDGPLRIIWPFEWADHQYVVTDAYCVDADCDCREATLGFFDVTNEVEGKSAAPVTELFSVAFSLDGTCEINELNGVDAKAAKLLVTVWKERHFDHLDQIRWRYAAMQEIGRRSGRTSKGSSRPRASVLPSMTLSSPMADVGRNDPCPCGSGMKYKKCCGR